MTFDGPFWEAKRADGQVGFVHTPGSPFPTLWTHYPLRTGLITAWAGGRAAIALSGKRQADLIASAVSSLARATGKRPAWVRQRMTAAYAHDWPADPFSRGAYSYIRVDGIGAREVLARPIAGTLHFAGEACDTEGQASTVAGALASGAHAAHAILRAQSRQ
jgi:monoamine oxidase